MSPDTDSISIQGLDVPGLPRTTMIIEVCSNTLLRVVMMEDGKIGSALLVPLKDMLPLHNWMGAAMRLHDREIVRQITDDFSCVIPAIKLYPADGGKDVM